MKYLEWLEEIGCDTEKLKITEAAAEAVSLPLIDPGSMLMKSINRIVVHHSATKTGNTAFFRVLHRIVNGWDDIGYHYVIGNGSLSGDGEIEQGRKLPFTGAHAKGGNTDSIGICLVGNLSREEPSEAQMTSLGLLLAKLTEKYSIPRESITLHRMVEGSLTECPGKKLTLKKVLYVFDGK